MMFGFIGELIRDATDWISTFIAGFADILVASTSIQLLSGFIFLFFAFFFPTRQLVLTPQHGQVNGVLKLKLLGLVTFSTTHLEGIERLSLKEDEDDHGMFSIVFHTRGGEVETGYTNLPLKRRLVFYNNALQQVQRTGKPLTVQRSSRVIWGMFIFLSLTLSWGIFKQTLTPAKATREDGLPVYKRTDEIPPNFPKELKQLDYCHINSVFANEDKSRWSLFGTHSLKLEDAVEKVKAEMAARQWQFQSRSDSNTAAATLQFTKGRLNIAYVVADQSCSLALQGL